MNFLLARVAKLVAHAWFLNKQKLPQWLKIYCLNWNMILSIKSNKIKMPHNIINLPIQAGHEIFTCPTEYVTCPGQYSLSMSYPGMLEEKKASNTWRNQQNCQITDLHDWQKVTCLVSYCICIIHFCQVTGSNSTMSHFYWKTQFCYKCLFIHFHFTIFHYHLLNLVIKWLCWGQFSQHSDWVKKKKKKKRQFILDIHSSPILMDAGSMFTYS